MNAAYDMVLTARSTAGGRSEWLRRLMAALNQAHLISEEGLTLSSEGTRPPEPVIEAINAVASHKDPPAIPPAPGVSPGMTELRDGLTGLECALSGDWSPPAVPGRARKPPLRDRLRQAGSAWTAG
jgi:hypothetical protein